MASCQGVRLNLAGLEDKEISLPVGSRLTLDGKLGDHSLAFSNDDGAEAMFTLGEGRVFGTFQTEKGESFVIEPCYNRQDGCYILIKQNNDFLDKLSEIGDVVKQKKV